ncbi:MAG: hypothetical protein RMK65_02430, partial [Anaerolineae bacterium]|nr:hypothetical protein [Anaerolineae bacterium]
MSAFADAPFRSAQADHRPKAKQADFMALIGNQPVRAPCTMPASADAPLPVGAGRPSAEGPSRPT